MNTAIRALNTLLLLAILGTLVLIWRRMPPTRAELKSVQGEARKAMLLRRPSIWIDGDITGSVSANIDQPLEVKVKNDPLDVSIVPQ